MNDQTEPTTHPRMRLATAYRHRLIELFREAVDETTDALLEFGCATVSELQDHIDANEIVLKLIDHIDALEFVVGQQTGRDAANTAHALAEIMADSRRTMEGSDR